MTNSSTGVQPPFLTSWSPSPQLACPLPPALSTSISCRLLSRAWLENPPGPTRDVFAFILEKFQLPYGITASTHQNILKWIDVTYICFECLEVCVVSQTLFVKYHQCLSYTGHYFCILWNVMCQITLQRHDLPYEVVSECFSSRIQRQCVKAVLVNHNATKAHSFH